MLVSQSISHSVAISLYVSYPANEQVPISVLQLIRLTLLARNSLFYTWATSVAFHVPLIASVDDGITSKKLFIRDVSQC